VLVICPTFTSSTACSTVPTSAVRLVLLASAAASAMSSAARLGLLAKACERWFCGEHTKKDSAQ
jgi:hypothetical protein